MYLHFRQSLLRWCSVVGLAVGGTFDVALAAPTPVAVAQVTQVELQDPVDLVGSVLPRRSALVSAQVNGLVEQIWVDEGSRVSAGDRLLQLDAELARINVSRSAARLTQARAEFKEAERQLREAERLRESSHIPLSALETAQTNVEVAAAVVGQNEAEVAAARETLKRHRVTAPFAGVVTRKMAELGQWLNTGSPALELIDTQTVRIEVAVPQRHIGGIAIGTQASISLDAFPGEDFTSSVSAIIPRDVDSARAVPVWLDVANPDGAILPGMSARVSVGLSSRGGLALAVPNDSLVRRADGSLLLWLVQDGEPDLTVTPVNVALGRRDARYSEVLSDQVKLGDRVVVRGNESLRPGQAVYIVEGYMVGGD